MPFGIKNAPAALNRDTEHIVQKFHFAHIFIDDFLLYSSSFEEHKSFTIVLGNV